MDKSSRGEKGLELEEVFQTHNRMDAIVQTKDLSQLSNSETDLGGIPKLREKIARPGLWGSGKVTSRSTWNLSVSLQRN